MAQEHGLTVEALIDALIAEYNTPYRAGRAVGVYANTMRYWLEKFGYAEVNGVWRKQAASRD